MHSGSLQARAENGFAARLYHARSDAQALGTEVCVLHALAIVVDVGGALGGLVASSGVRAQDGEHLHKVALIELIAAYVGPLAGVVGVIRVERLGDRVQVLFGVEQVHNLDRAREVLCCQAPNQMLRTTFDLICCVRRYVA